MKEDDFGFTFEDTGGIIKEDDRVEKIMNLVIPFLKNLQKSPELDTIRWPNRATEIDKFIKKLNDIKGK